MEEKTKKTLLNVQAISLGIFTMCFIVTIALMIASCLNCSAETISFRWHLEQWCIILGLICLIVFNTLTFFLRDDKPKEGEDKNV